MKKVIFCALALLITNICTAKPPVPKLIAKSSAVKTWEIRKNTRFTQSKWPDGSPGYCGKLTLEKYKQGNEMWPALVWRTTPGVSNDWSKLITFKTEVYSHTGGYIRINFRSLKDGRKVNSTCNIPLKKGLNKISVPRSALESLNLRNLVSFNFFLSRPNKDYTFYIGDIYATFEDLQATKKEFLKSAEKILKQDISRLPSFEKNQCIKAQNDLKKIISNLKTQNDINNKSLTWQLNKASDLLKTIKVYSQIATMLGANNSKAAAVGWVPPCEKVFQTKQSFSVAPSATWEIPLAQNEREGAQMIVYAFENLKNAKVIIKKFPSKSDGTKIANAELSVHPVGYVFCEQPRYSVERTGYQPDPILEYASKLDMKSKTFQSYYFEVKTSNKTAAGIYKGALELTANGIKPIEIPFSIKVYGFALPDGTPYHQAMARGATRLGPWKKLAQSTSAQKAFYEKCMKFYVDYRLSPDSLYRQNAPSLIEAKKILKNKGGIFNIIYIKPYGPDKQGKYPKEIRKHIFAELKRMVPEYRRAGILNKAYIYAFDETGPDKIGVMRDILSEVKKAYPNIPILTTSQDSTYGIKFGVDKYVDMWCPLTCRIPLTQQAVDAAIKRGKKIWWYTCISPRMPYANFFVEAPAIDSRLLMGMMTWKYKAAGFLYYSMAMWRDYKLNKNGKWTYSIRTWPMKGAPLTNWPGYSWRDSNGDGNWVYPSENGPIPSLRLKNIMDGLEDYYYLKLLRQAVLDHKNGKLKLSSEWLKKTEKALQAPERLVKSLIDFNRSYKTLQKERNKIAVLLEEANSQK